MFICLSGFIDTLSEERIIQYRTEVICIEIRNISHMYEGHDIFILLINIVDWVLYVTRIHDTYTLHTYIFNY